MKRASQSSPRATAEGKTVSVLFTCVGRRIELIDAFRRAGARLGIDLRVHGADVGRSAPGMHRVDAAHVVPAINAPAYVPALCRLVSRHGIDLLIPSLDPDLPVLARAVDALAAAGCRAVVSTVETVDICRDKLTTFDTLRRAKIDTPRTWDWRDMVARSGLRYPLFMKPRSGSAAVGNFKITDRQELQTLGRRVPSPIVQEFVDGIEHTLDVYCGLDGQPRCVVPRRRLEVRTGEVSKALTVKDPAIMETGRRVAEALGGCRGVITVQCMVTPKGRVRVIEINPRFGGGVPLAIEAGADFPRWLLTEHLGRRPRIRFDGFRDNLAMLRYDQSIFVPGSKLNLPARK